VDAMLRIRDTALPPNATLNSMMQDEKRRDE
jgi:hypothetical protein